MRLLTFRRADGSLAAGSVVAGGVVDLTKRLGVASLRALFASGKLDEARRLESADLAAGEAREEGGLRRHRAAGLGDVVAIVQADADDLVGIGDHGREGQPVQRQVGHGQPMIRPRASTEFDYEGELAVVIGKGGRHIAAADALKHVAGYACYNEGSIRDWQRHTSQFLAGKTFADTGAFGPWLVTSDEIPDPSKLTLETRVNGQVVQHTTTGLMITPVPQLIEYISTVLPLLPGDVIVSGTPGGVGAKRNPPLWLKPGDVTEVEISGIGILRNPVEAES